MRRSRDFFLEKNVPTRYGVVVLMILSALVGWFTIRTGEKIIERMPQSTFYNVTMEKQKMINQGVR